MKLSVTGIISRILYEGDKNFIFAVHVHEGTEDYEIQCTLAGKRRNQAINLKPGQQVKVNGVLLMFTKNTRSGIKVQNNGFFVKEIEALNR